MIEPIQSTHRVYAGADNAITLWVRDDEGSRDFGGTEEVPAELSVTITPYGGNRELASLDAESAQAGKVTFTVDETTIEQQLAPGLFSFRVLFGAEVVRLGILEVVG